MATRFKSLVVKHGAQQSMSQWGNCYGYDNAHAESFWGRFKAELLDDGYFPNLAEAKLEISHHIAYSMPNDDTPPSATTRPTTLNPNSKPRPNCIRLS